LNSEITVLIPCHGNAPFLVETIVSIYESTLLPEQVLIIDDGMDAATLKSISGFSADSRITVIPSRGSGLVDALNTGLKASTTKYIARIDADDRMLALRLEEQRNFLIGCADAVTVGSQCYFIDSHGVRTGISSYPVGLLNKNRKFISECRIAHPSAMYLRDTVITAGGYRSVFKFNGTDIAEDFDLWLRLAKFGNLYNLSECYVEYRQHADQISSKLNAGQILGTTYISAINRKSYSDALPVMALGSDSNLAEFKEFFAVIKKHHSRFKYFQTKIEYGLLFLKSRRLRTTKAFFLKSLIKILRFFA